MITYNEKKSKIILMILMLTLILSACSPQGENKKPEETQKKPELVEVEEADKDKKFPKDWVSDRPSWIDDTKAGIIKYYGYNSFIYDDDKVDYLPDVNKFEIVYTKEDNIVDLHYYFPKGAKLNDIELKEGVNIYWKVNLNDNTLFDYRQENEEGKSVEIFKLEEENLIKKAQKEKKHMTQ